MLNTTPEAKPVPQSAGNMNLVIDIGTPPSGYTAAPHVKPAHHVYGGTPVFQTNYHLIPHNMASHRPDPPSVVRPMQYIPIQSDLSPDLVDID